MGDFIGPIAYRGTNFKVKIETLEKEDWLVDW
jgi:hypothetical protein